MWYIFSTNLDCRFNLPCRVSPRTRRWPVVSWHCIDIYMLWCTRGKRMLRYSITCRDDIARLSGLGPVLSVMWLRRDGLDEVFWRGVLGASFGGLELRKLGCL